MYYYDEFGKEFKDELSFHEYLEEIDERAKWIRIPSRSLRQHISVVIVMASLFMVMQTTIWHRSLGRLSIKR